MNGQSPDRGPTKTTLFSESVLSRQKAVEKSVSLTRVRRQEKRVSLSRLLPIPPLLKSAHCPCPFGKRFLRLELVPIPLSSPLERRPWDRSPGEVWLLTLQGRVPSATEPRRPRLKTGRGRLIRRETWAQKRGAQSRCLAAPRHTLLLSCRLSVPLLFRCHQEVPIGSVWRVRRTKSHKCPGRSGAGPLSPRGLSRASVISAASLVSLH